MRNYEFIETAGMSFWQEKKTDWRSLWTGITIVGLLVIAIYLSI